MIHIGNIQIDIEAITTVVTSVLALLFAYLAWKNQVKERLTVTASPVVLNNNPILQFDTTSFGSLTISNIGYKYSTVTNIKLCIDHQEISVKQFCDNNPVNVLIAPGEVKYYNYNKNLLIDYISHCNFNKDSYIYWCIYTSTNRRFVCKTENRVSNVIDVNVGDGDE